MSERSATCDQRNLDPIFKTREAKRVTIRQGPAFFFSGVQFDHDEVQCPDSDVKRLCSVIMCQYQSIADEFVVIYLMCSLKFSK